MPKTVPTCELSERSFDGVGLRMAIPNAGMRTRDGVIPNPRLPAKRYHLNYATSSLARGEDRDRVVMV